MKPNVFFKKYEYVSVFEHSQNMNTKKWIGFSVSGTIKPTLEICSLSIGDKVIIATNGKETDCVVTHVSESVSGKQFYIWIEPYQM